MTFVQQSAERGVLAAAAWVFMFAAGSEFLRGADPEATPPVAAIKPVDDDYFGTKITDPYR